MTETSIITKLHLLLEQRARNKTLDINSTIEERDNYMLEDIKESYEMNAWHDCLALKWSQWLAFGISSLSCYTLSYMIQKSFKARRYRLVWFSTIGLPAFLGSMSAMGSQHFVDSMLRLEQNCRQCYHVKMIGAISVFPLFHQALLNTGLTWVGQTEKKNIIAFRRLRNETALLFLKRQVKDYLQKMNHGNVWTKTAAVVVVAAALAYLLSLEQQREFIIVFNKYYEDLLNEVELQQDGIDMEKNSQI